MGTLLPDEDGRSFYFDHPIEESDSCNFVVEDWVLLDSLVTGETRNCPAGYETDANEKFQVGEICYGMEPDSYADVDAEIEFLPDVIAGYTCEGGTYDTKDSNEAP